MAESVEEVIPAPVLELARDFGVEDADWYVGSAESGRGSGALAALRQMAKTQKPGDQQPAGDPPQAAHAH